MPELQRRLQRADDCERYENNFSDFLQAAWHAIDSSPYQQNWACDAVCDHLEAVTLDQLKKAAHKSTPEDGKNERGFCRLECLDLGARKTNISQRAAG